MPIKILGQKSYGSIPHLPSSRLGEKDYCISEGQARIATLKTRDKHDIVIVQEKLDGSNVSVAKVDGNLYALTRSGYLAKESQYLQHRIFAEWVNENSIRFKELLNEGERLCGEWLAMATGTIYKLPHEPFVAFDLMTKSVRLPYLEYTGRAIYFDFVFPNCIQYNSTAMSIEMALQMMGKGRHGAMETVEGCIWRVERKGEVDFLTKYVRHDKEDGKYFEEKTGNQPIWNINISKYKNL